MLVKVNIPLLTMDGQVMKDQKEELDEKGEKHIIVIDATVQMAIVNAILSPVQNEKGVDKVRKYELAKRIYANDEIDLNEDEIKEIKERVGELYAPIIVGQVYELLKV